MPGQFTDLVVNKETIDMLQSKCAEFLVHAVDVEGKMSGIEEVGAATLLSQCDGRPHKYLVAGVIHTSGVRYAALWWGREEWKDLQVDTDAKLMHR